MEKSDKHPDVIAWDEWKAANPSTLDPCTLRPVVEHSCYLENRLISAFQAGIEHGRKPTPPADSGWIRTSDRLPGGEHDAVWASDKHGVVSRVGRDSFLIYSSRFTHWSPAPAPAPPAKPVEVERPKAVAPAFQQVYELALRFIDCCEMPENAVYAVGALESLDKGIARLVMKAAGDYLREARETAGGEG